MHSMYVLCDAVCLQLANCEHTNGVRDSGLLDSLLCMPVVLLCLPSANLRQQTNESTHRTQRSVCLTRVIYVTVKL